MALRSSLPVPSTGICSTWQKLSGEGIHSGGKPDTPACTTCHTDSPLNTGKTRAGKAIEPMAVSANPQRFTDMEKVEKWFGRNCNSVLGRDCTPQEKGDVATWLIAQ